MSILSLAESLLPLLGVILVGFVAGRVWSIHKQSIANLVINTITPVVIFGYLAKTNFGLHTVTVPLAAFLVTCIGAALIFGIASSFFDSPAKNLITFQAASGNTGYFGIPLFVALFGEANLGTYMLAIVGYMLFETSIGYYLLARGTYSVKASLMRVARLPPIYGMVSGLLYSFLHFNLPPWFGDLLSNFRGTYIILGMMMIGLAFSDSTSFRLNFKALGVATIGRFLLLPLLVTMLLWLDQHSLALLGLAERQALMVFSIIPPAANSVAYAIQLHVLPEEAALNLLLLTLLGFAVALLVGPGLHTVTFSAH